MKKTIIDVELLKKSSLAICATENVKGSFSGRMQMTLDGNMNLYREIKGSHNHMSKYNFLII